MSWIEIIADRKIRDAQEEGHFDNLPGKGQPLHLEFDPRVPPEQRAAYRLMKDAQLLPDWIQLDKEIRQRQERWRARVEEFARTREEELQTRGSARSGTEALDRRRDRFLRQTAEELRDLNRMIDRLNLIVPATTKQRIRLNLAERMEELEARFPRGTPYPSGQAAPWAPLVEEDRPPTRLSNRMPLRRKRGSIG